jgi:Protein of unknown function (DUF3568)
MKIKFLAVLALAAAALTGCVRTVSDTHTFASTISKDTITSRYSRSLDQVYQAAVVVIQNNGVLTKEYITPGTNNVPLRSLQGKVNQAPVWIRVEAVDARVTQVQVQSRDSWGSSNVQLASELSTEIALQLAR